MAKSKAKWLTEATTRELVVLVKECLKEEDLKKVDKIIAELLDRIPEGDDNLTVADAIKRTAECLEDIQKAYDQEAKYACEAEDEEEEEEEPPKKRSKKSRRSKKEAKPDPDPIEEDEEEEDYGEEEDEEDEGYEDMSQGELKKELRRRGIKVTKSMKKADMIRALEADDEE